MLTCDILICNAIVIDGSGNAGEVVDVAIKADRIVRVGSSLDLQATTRIDGAGLTLSPGFIDVHTHDDLSVIVAPRMLPKLTQGVTTVIVGNCGISASPVSLHNGFPDPMNLLGTRDEFVYSSFAEYLDGVEAACPAVNVGALVGHTSLRNNQMDELNRTASDEEIEGMRRQLKSSLEAGALGLSTGLAYMSAFHASTHEVLELASLLAPAHAVYATHIRTESDAILEAMQEAFYIGAQSEIPVIISHLKCAGIANWGRSREVLAALDKARLHQPAGCDCYPYAAGSSTLDLRQVDDRVTITITWSAPHPDVAGQSLEQIAKSWNVTQYEAAQRLQPAGAIYHSIAEEDMRRILAHPATMIGSDGLPRDPRPHPRLWGAFARVLGRYCREEQLLSLPNAIHKMTSMPAKRFGLAQRGRIREGNFADLVLFNANTIGDMATYEQPTMKAAGVVCVWVNGALSYDQGFATEARAGKFLRRQKADWIQ